MKSKGIIFMSVLVLLIIISIIGSSVVVHLHEFSRITHLFIIKEEAHYYLNFLDPYIKDILNNNMDPSEEKLHFLLNEATITTDIIDAQSKPNINNFQNPKKINLLKNAIHYCHISEDIEKFFVSSNKKIFVNTVEDFFKLNFPSLNLSSKKIDCLTDLFYFLPEETPININTATFSTLKWLYPSTSPSLLGMFIEERKKHFFNTMEMINNDPYLGILLRNNKNLTLKSDYFYTITTVEKNHYTVIYKTLWHRAFNPHFHYLEKLWTIET